MIGAVMTLPAIRPFVPVVTEVGLIHWFNAFLSLCLCYAAGFVTCGTLVVVLVSLSIAALYSPRRAARLHLAR